MTRATTCATTRATTCAIVFDDVSLEHGGVTRLSHLSLEVNRGEVLGLLGHNGAGKTTSMKLMLGLLSPTQGSLSVLGQRPDRAGDRAFRQHLGYLPENVRFYPNLSGRETLTYLARLKGRPTTEVDELLVQVGLGEAADRRLATWSKGMRQRLGLAQALLGEPRLLLLDEPTSGLDPAATEAVYATIGMLKARGVTVVLSSHLLPGVEPVIDRALILGEGKCLALGDLASLRERFALPYVIEMRGAPQDLALRLIREGIPARSSLADGGRLRLEVAPEHRMNALRLCTAFQGLKDLEIRPPSLEALYRRVQGCSGRDPGNGSEGNSESDASDRYQVIDEIDHTTVSPSAEDTP
ncbi:ABC transporter ATP-binding protein [Halomonas sp. YLB-10]|uniref:ABC transporter ATP-binding protein n=1 Tax=Halomonas sp. YLB-10 TaxID=2483111 RepID=UPI000F6014F1|nr:ABC transporter ATP-binding protein [Halomonas sp. YLB-10]MBS8270808.1 ABC transporter ATP-binding protein [Halomonas litopenaei]RQW70466.1 ABC transporter ATP-binding protein [Halomonas sp. YLB-10]